MSREGQYKEIGEKILDISQLPEGPLTRYQRGLYAFSEHKDTMTFEEFQIQWGEQYEEKRKYEDKHHPVLYKKEIKIGPKQYVTIFKREGRDWICSFVDYYPNGGGGHISVEEALEKISDPKITEEVVKINNGDA
tara:strand:+ start:10834 stop:11238 length:405 start_codon:yes stop_codon:yes gene_type:complete